MKLPDRYFHLRETLAEHYRLIRELGRGGMATVYLAHDLKHDRPVALKVLRPEVAAALGPERFQREIKLSASLQHPHILTVHDSGEAAGELWFTMPFVDGESLRQRLAREHQLPLEDSLRIAREIADALEYAHRRGIVHRDIKPENILLSGSHALVTDFGIARALGGETHLTETGIAVGTPGYMSPEQARGNHSLDPRSDVYALGCVLYEMLAGEPPVRAARLGERLPPIHRLRPGVPPALDRILARSLAAVPVERFASAADFGRALETVLRKPWLRRPVVAVTGIVLLLAVGALFSWRSLGKARQDGSAKVVAILPFENTGSSEQEYFSDGMTDEVRGKLTTVPGLQVIGRASSTPFKRTAKTPQQIARELGAQYLLTATVRWEQLPDGRSRVRVSPELVQVRAGVAPTTKWQQSFDAELTNVFQVQADIATRVARSLDVALSAEAEQRLAAPPTANAAAYDAFLRGEDVTQGMAGNPLEFRRAATYYERAVAIDSSFADAWAKLSRTHSFLYQLADGTPADSAAAQRAAERALALAPDAPASHLAWGDYYRLVAWDLPKALDHYFRGHRLAPNNAELLGQIGGIEYQLGQPESALDYMLRAQKLDPRSVGATWAVAMQLGALRRYDESLEMVDRGLSFAPANLDLLQAKMLAHLIRGDLSGTRSVLRSVPKEVDPATLVAYMAVYWELLWVLDDDQQQLLLRLTPSAFAGNRCQWGYARAQTYALRGERTRARAFADTARIACRERVRTLPRDPSHRANLGWALAYLGRSAEAKREGERALAMRPIEKDMGWGPFLQHQLVRIHILLNEHDKALDYLEPLIVLPYVLTPGWLGIDPNFAPLRGHPRFERILAAAK